MRKQLTAFTVAAQFLTTCPPVIKRLFLPEELGRAVGYFPLVGALLGGLLVGAHTVLGWLFPAPVVAALILAMWVLASGALHLDGFIDSCDGLMGGFTPEDRLRIMRDERIGGYAFAGGALLLLAKYAALQSLGQPVAALVLAPVLGRWALSAAIVALPYARAQGLGRDMKENVGRPQLVLATIVAWLAAALAGAWGLLAFAVAAIVTWAGARFVLGRIPGMTGDTYGGLCELVEAATLLVFCLRV